MARQFSATRLFEAWRYRSDPKLNIYPTIESSLDAIQARKKGMSMFPGIVGTIAEPESELAYWLNLAFERDLLVVIHGERFANLTLQRQPIHLFFSRPDELWRIPAWLALWKTAFVDGRWSNAAENQMSHLLGYTEKQRKRWIESQRQRKPAWTCSVIYALLSADQRKTVESVGRRCFGPTASIEGMSLFFHSGDVLKKNALALVPKGSTLARVGLRWKEFHEVFGKFKDLKPRSLIERTVTKKLAPVINAALLSNVQFLTRSGWK